MKCLLGLCLFAFVGCNNTKGHANQFLTPYQWEKRILLIFSHKSTQSLLEEQKKILKTYRNDVKDRDLLVFTIPYGKSTFTTASKNIKVKSSVFYETFNVEKDDFSVILIGKDGGEKHRKTNQIISKEELFKIIDAMPMRKIEKEKKKSEE
jgi:hypothetical protein